MTDEYGEPDVLTNNMALWNGRISEFTQTYVKDESIPHCCPKPHNDYVYSTMVIDVPEELMEAIAKASESIIVDQLKNEVTARCADIYANAITLGFVQKLVKGDIDPEDSKEEYERHILEGMLPEWFEEKVEEGKKKKKKKKKKGGKKDACYHKVKARYDVWPSAYASGALVKCRKVGAANWGKSTTKEELELYEGKESLEAKIRNALIEEGGAAGMKALKDHTEASEKEIKDAIEGMEDVGLHEDGDYILQDGAEIDVEKTIDEKKKKAGTESSKESSLRDWFGRKGAKGKKKGWVDCNAPDGKGGYKACGREEGEKRSKYPACRPTPGACKERGKGKSWGKKGTKKENLNMNRQRLMEIINEELEEAYYSMLSEGETLEEAEYQGRKVTLNKPMRGDVKKSKVYVKNAKGNVVKVNFGDKNMRIRKSNPKARKSFRARHNCKNPGPKWKARYWSCKMW